jgi:Fe-S-cluster containining protein
VRPGVRYTCFSDGLCCTNIHGLGPLTERELVHIRKLDPKGVDTQGYEEPMLAARADGSCVFLRSDGLCSIHAKWGPETKPAGCRRFPLGLVATPSGGRVTTEHRCPCRTLGERPEVTAEAVEPSLKDDAGRLEADKRVSQINVDRKRRLSFSKWEQMERRMLDSLQAGDKPSKALGVGPFPPLGGTTWKQEAEELLESEDETRFWDVLMWFADAVLSRQSRYKPPKRERPWSWAFDRAEGRGGPARDPESVLSDWVADQVWALGWVGEHPFKKAAFDIVTRYTIARQVMQRIGRLDVEPGRAAAEAIMVVDTIGASEYWTDIVARMRW